MSRPTAIWAALVLGAAATAPAPATAQDQIRIQVPPGTSREDAIRMAREKIAEAKAGQNGEAAAADEAQPSADTSEDAKPAAKKPEAKDKTIKVEPERLKITLDVSGKFVAAESSEVALRPMGWSKMEVVSVVPHGTKVREGETLVEIDTEDLERAVAAAERALETAQIELESAELSQELLEQTMPIDMAAAERKVKQAEDDLAYYLSVSKGLAEKSTRESLERSRFSLEYAQEELNQLRQMYEADDLTEQTEEIILKRAQRAAKSAESSLENAEARAKKQLEVDLPRTEQSLRDATAKTLAGKKKTMASMKAAMRQAELGLESKRLAVEAAERKLDELREDLEVLSSVTAPQSGFVYYGRFKDGSWGGKDKAELVLKPGGSLPSKTVLMTVVSPAVAGLQGTVSEKDVSKLRPGLTGKGEAAAMPDAAFEATVDSVTRVPVASGKFGVLFKCDGVPEAVVPGLSGKATLTTYDRADALVLPKSAVGGEGDDRFVTMADGSRRPVVLGKSKGEDVEITGGLRAGEEVKSKPEE